MQDVIVVGARCAGSPMARLLARDGVRVLLVDRAKFPSDTLSTHFFWPRGLSYLNRWGLLEKALAVTPSDTHLDMTIEDAEFSASTPVSFLKQRFEEVHGDSDGVVSRYACIRRKLVDSVLLEGAIEAGADYRAEFSVDSLIFEQGRVAGIRGHSANGNPVEERAKLVVGADGRNSIVASSVGAHPYFLQEECSCCYWSYFTGFRFPRGMIQKRGRLAMAIIPTSFGANMTLVWGPKNWLPKFKSNLEENILRVLTYINPEVGEIVRSQGKREEKIYGTNEQTAYRRPSVGNGWLLAGDATCFKDQCGAIGMTHAFRDAELASKAIVRSLSGDAGALTDYALIREQDTRDNFEFVCQQARTQAASPQERLMFQRMKEDKRQGDAFMAMYGDTLHTTDFLAQVGGAPTANNPSNATDGSEVFLTEVTGQSSLESIALSRNATDFLRPEGNNLISRTEPFYDWWKARNTTGTWQYGRTLEKFPGPRTTLVDESGRRISGINFASQDYLALGQHPAVHEAAVQAIRDFGPHSAGSAVVIGNTTISRRLEADLGELLDTPYLTLFPTGWAAGFGAINALVKEQDYVVMDRLSHACLQQGIRASTKNIVKHEHLDVNSAREKLKQIRSRDAKAGILVVSEGLFSMDSDSPDLARLQEVCHEYGAVLFVDVAHDLGSTGPGGTGQLGIQNLLGRVDLVMGSFSKTFASNGGFLATRNPAVMQYVRTFSNAHVFSNALSPVQTAVVRASIKVIRSPEGDKRRQDVLSVVNAMREEFKEQGIQCIGNPSPIIPVPIGPESVSRIAHRLLGERNIAAMNIEFPLVAVGFSRFRLQAMASHAVDEGRFAAKSIAEVIEEARHYVEGRA